MTLQHQAVVICFFALTMMSGQTDAPDTAPTSQEPVDLIAVQMRTLRQAFDAVERSNTAEALGHIDRLIEMEPPIPLQNSARVLRGQISGAFKTRQAFWLKRNVADLVVLVPDEAACLEAMQQWTADCYWPVLIEDGWFTPIFVAAFGPNRIWRWSGEPAKSTTKVEKGLLDTIQAHNGAWSLDRQKRPSPPGLVVIDPHSPGRLGGLALALGRRQPIAIMRLAQRVRTILSRADTVVLNAHLMKAATYWGLTSNDTWFGLTLAGPFPYRYREPLPTEGNQVGDTPGRIDRTLRAVDDLVGRPALIGGHRVMRAAVVGRLIGTPAQVVYQAMCSLFLQPKRTLWVDGYSTRRGAGWQAYGMNQAVDLMRQRFECELLAAPQIGVQQFRQKIRPINPYDMIWINSSGGPNSWMIAGRSNSDDFPIGSATAMHVIHSHSLANAWNVNTLAGRAIAGGAYWYFGAMAEPYLTAFNRPTGMACKILAGTPVAFAARQLPGQHSASPWRTMLVGDPLFTLIGEQTPRIQIEAIEGAQPVMQPEDTAPLTARLRDTVLVQRQAARELALTCLEKPDPLEADDLARAVWVLYGHGTFDTLSALSDELLKGHRMARILVHLSRLTSTQYDPQKEIINRTRINDPSRGENSSD